MSSPFEVRGRVSVVESAAALLLRWRDGWEVLMTDSEVINWLRSTPEKLVPMRYGGEWRLPGGNVDAGETHLEAMRRELVEELPLDDPAAVEREAVLRPFAVRQTRPVRSRSNMIHYFAVLESENKWLAEFDASAANAALRARREAFRKLFLSGEFARLPLAEKEKTAPEQHSFRWMRLDDAATTAMSAAVPNAFASKFQEMEYKTWGLTRQRDPTYLTGFVLKMLRAYPSEAALQAHLASVGDTRKMADKARWITDGMTQDEVDAAVDRLNKKKRKTKPALNLKPKL